MTDWLGRGGMGVVFKGFDEALNRYVAIKVLAPQWAPDASARRRFSREARAAAAISHPHVITIHAVGEWKARPFLVMEYVTGISLQQRLDDGARLELREILRIGMQIALGLADAHAQGLIHRDIKPANIMLENDLARVKITDFGLARAVDDTFLTQLGTLAGTPRYMAPEQARGDRLDRRADLFSLGGVLYALCTGQPAFQGDSTPAVIRQVCEAEPTPIRVLEPEIPVWLAEIIDRLLDKDPAERFQSASEVAELLSRHLARDQDSTLPPVQHPWVRRPGRRYLSRRAKRLLSALVFLSALLLLTRTVLQPATQPPEVPGSNEGETMAAAVADARLLKQGYHQDFRKSQFDGAKLRIEDTADHLGSVRPGPEGLLVSVPQGKGAAVGVVTKFGVRGDFEITASFETLSPMRPDVGYGLGPDLLIKPSGGWDNFASLSRFRRPDEVVFSMVHRFKVGDELKWDAHSVPTEATRGRLRLVRIGRVLHYQVAESDESGFNELFQSSFGTQDLEFVRIAATPGNSPCPVEVIWGDLTIRAEELFPGRNH